MSDLGLMFGAAAIVAFGWSYPALSAIFVLISLICVYAGERVFVDDPKTRGLAEATKALNKRRNGR